MSSTKQISNQEVERIAKLARLGLSDEEIKKATVDLQDILGHFAAIQGIDTAGVPTSADVTGLKNITREDQAEVSRLGEPGELLSRAPERKGKQVKVTAVFS